MSNVVGIDEMDGRLLFTLAEADFEDSIPVALQLLNLHPNVTVTNQLLDSHLYIISCRALQSLQNKR